MRATVAIVIAGTLIAIAILVAFRWQITAATGIVYRLDRWTGDIVACEINPGPCYSLAKELLALSAPLPTAELVGLAGPDGKGINRRYVERWLGRKAEEQRRREVSNSRWIKIGVWVAIATVGVALAAWWFPR
jgi:hypothetical protein